MNGNPWRPSRTRLRWFAAVWFPVACALVGWVVARRTGAWTAVGVGWGVAAAWSAAGSAYPPAARPLFVALRAATLPLGWAVPRLLLGAIYFGLLTPIGLALRLAGHDPLHLRGASRERGAWQPVEPGSGPGGYLRQS